MPVLYKINEHIAEMGENYASIMDNYFDIALTHHFSIQHNLLNGKISEHKRINMSTRSQNYMDFSLRP